MESKMKEIKFTGIAIQASIKNLSTILSLPPRELVDAIDKTYFTDTNESDEIQRPHDAIYISNNLQEALNSIIDARKRLIELGFFEIGSFNEEETPGIQYSKPQTGVETRSTIPKGVVETNKNTDNEPVHLSPNP